MSQCLGTSETTDADKCNCQVCKRDYRKPVSVLKLQRFNDVTELPFGQSLFTVLDRLNRVKLVQRVRLNILEIFFFRDSKVHQFFYTNEKGQLTLCSSFVNLKKVETIIINCHNHEIVSQHIGETPVSPQFSSVHEKQERKRKMKNDVAIIKIVNGGYMLVSEFNLPFEIQKARHIEYIQLFKKEQTEFVKFDYQTDKTNALFRRAQNYILVLKGELTDWDQNYVSRDEEATFELELFRSDLQSMLQYLTFKIVNILNLTNILVLKGRFDWIIHKSTSIITLHNVQGLQYCPAKASEKADLNVFVESRQKRLQRKIEAVNDATRKSHYEWNHRVSDCQATILQDYEKVKSELVGEIPKIDKLSTSDRVFKIMHPDIKANLSEMMKNENLFRRTMKSIYRPKRTQARQKKGKSQNLLQAMTLLDYKIPVRSVQKTKQRESFNKQRSYLHQSFKRSISKSLRFETCPNLQNSQIQINLSRILNRAAKRVSNSVYY